MSDLVGNPEDRFSHDEAHIKICAKGADRMENSVDPDMGLHCLLTPICPKTLGHYVTLLIHTLIYISFKLSFQNNLNCQFLTLPLKL